MPSLEENKENWSNTESWLSNGDEWSCAWGDTEYMWYSSIFPRIMKFLSVDHILEIAPGHGRCTQYLEKYCEQVSIVDLTQECIEFCKDRFKGSNKIKYYVNDGKSLSFIEDNSVDFIFSWDSLVHCEKDVIEEYIKEFSRILTKNGVGFIHHSNMGSYNKEVKNSHWRGRSMSAEFFDQYCAKYGLKCISQEIVPWGQEEFNDCFSVFTRKHSCFDSNKLVLENTKFLSEMNIIKNIAYTYNPVLKKINEININMLSKKDILEKLSKKKVIGWGTGNYYSQCQMKDKVEIEYFIDSDVNKQGKVLEEKSIHNPNKLLNENKNDIFIIIYSKAGYYNIAKWLIENEFSWGEHFYFFQMIE